MKCDELTPIDLECNMGKDSVTGLVNHEPWKAYDIDEVDEAIAELKQFAEDACLERDDNQTAIDELQAENAELKAKLDKAIAERDGNQVCIDALKQKLENVQASAYADSVDAGMRERRLRRALYKACANWAMNARMVEIEAEPWGENHESRLWAGVYDKCLKKAEEYK